MVKLNKRVVKFGTGGAHITMPVKYLDKTAEVEVEDCVKKKRRGKK